MPFTEDELEDMREKEEVEMTVGSRAFSGINVPDTCIVKMYCNEWEFDEM